MKINDQNLVIFTPHSVFRGLLRCFAGTFVHASFLLGWLYSGGINLVYLINLIILSTLSFIIHMIWNRPTGHGQLLFVAVRLHLRWWDHRCHTNMVFVQHTDFMGFIRVISIMSTCALINLHVDTSEYRLPGLPSSSGGCSCVGFLFWGFFFSPPHTLAKSWFGPHIWSKALLPSVLPRCTWQAWLGLFQCGRHHPFLMWVFTALHSADLGWHNELIRTVFDVNNLDCHC